MASAIPLIDLRDYPLASNLAPKVASACESLGFIYLKGHGLEDDAKRVFEISRDFFENETLEEKMKCKITDNKGYGGLGREVLDPSKGSDGDEKENFNLGILMSGGQPCATQPLSPILEQNIDELHHFQKKCFDLCQHLLAALAIALKLPDTYFTSYHTFTPTNESILRLLRYPYVSSSDVHKHKKPTAGAHSDYGSLTLLFQKPEGGGGLQVFPPTASFGREGEEEKEWRDVEVIEDAVLVNVGDAFEFWTNGLYKSTIHRVVPPQAASGEPTSKRPDRYTMAFFDHADPEAILKSVIPAEERSCLDVSRMERKGVKAGEILTASEHLQRRLKATYSVSNA